MTVHRPHPLTGPYPYGVRDSTGEVAPRHPWSDAFAVPLVDRIPLDESVVYDDPDDAVLYDGCDRCIEHASHPFDSLDDDNFGALWAEMVRVEKDGPTYAAHYRTRAEADACRQLYRVACILGRIAPMIDPWTWPLRVTDDGVADRVLENVLDALGTNGREG